MANDNSKTVREESTRSGYGQTSDQVAQSTDVSRQASNRVSSGSTVGKSIQAGDQTEFVNVGCNVSFTVKIRGGFPTTPGNC